MSRLPVAVIALLAACHHHRHFERTDLVSDQPGVAPITDPGLVNAWGLAGDNAGRVFVAANGTGQISLYDNRGHGANGFPIMTPGAAPITGLAANRTSGFVITGDLGTAPADLLVATEDGTVFAVGAQASSVPVKLVDQSAAAANFKGLAIAERNGAPVAMMADFANNQVVQIDTGGKPISSSAAFRDPGVPAGFAPFGIQHLDALIYVTFAKQGDGGDEAHGPGLGVVDAFATDGTFLRRVASGVELNAPWGLAMSANGFGDFGDALLVGNFGDGLINAYDPFSGELLGALADRHGDPFAIPGLWGLAIMDDRTLFYAAGPDDENHGLFGMIRADDD